MDTAWDRWVWWAILCMMAVLWLVALPACASGSVEAFQNESTDTVAPTCTVDEAQHPFRDAVALPGGRGFLASGNHLGWDLLATEGMPVYPIGCGVVRLARSANGYGTLVVVIEHRLRKPTALRNGRGGMMVTSSLLSIYGHLRPTSEGNGRGVSAALRVGEQVSAERVIGYIEHDARNGDGSEHLHFGIRLQSAIAAQQSDPAGWFRGYDASPSQRGWFADPQEVVRTGAISLERDAGSLAPTFDAAIIADVGNQRIDAFSRIDQPIAPDLPTSWQRDVGIDSMIDSGVLLPDLDVGNRIRYEFRVRSSLRVSPPYRLRDLWWNVVSCDNSGSSEMEVVAGWARCDAERLELFDGSFFVPDNPDWGDRGQIGTVSNVPNRCTPVEGAEWRLTELATQRVLFQGPVASLSCRAVGSQDRLQFPE